MYKIDENVELPPKKSELRRRYPFKEMKVGDSFFISCDDTHRQQRRVHAAARGHKDKRFVTRQSSDGVRVWRVE